MVNGKSQASSIRAPTKVIAGRKFSLLPSRIDLFVHQLFGAGAQLLVLVSFDIWKYAGTQCANTHSAGIPI